MNDYIGHRGPKGGLTNLRRNLIIEALGIWARNRILSFRRPTELTLSFSWPYMWPAGLDLYIIMLLTYRCNASFTNVPAGPYRG